MIGLLAMMMRMMVEMMMVIIQQSIILSTHSFLVTMMQRQKHQNFFGCKSRLADDVFGTPIYMKCLEKLTF